MRSEASLFRLWLLLVTGLFGASLLVSRFMPFIDYPQHVAEIAILVHYDDPTFRFSELYAPVYGGHPYLLHLKLLSFLGAVTNPDLACRLYLLLMFIGVPVATLRIIHAIGGDRWSVAFSFIGLYSFAVGSGFVTYSVGTLGVLVLTAYLESAKLELDRRRLGVLAAGGIVLFFLHPMTYLYWLATVLIFIALGVASAKLPRGLALKLALALAPGFIFGVALSLTDPDLVSTGATSFAGVVERFATMPFFLGAYWSKPLYWIAIGSFLAVPLIAKLAPGTPAAPSSAATTFEHLWAERHFVLMVAYIAGYFVLPEGFREQNFFSSRLLGMALLVLPAAVSRAAMWRKAVVRAWVAIAALVLGTFYVVAMFDFDRESHEFADIIEQVPVGSSYKCQIDDRRANGIDLPVYRHYCGYVLAERGGYAGFLFRNAGIEFKPPYFIPHTDLYRWEYDPSGRFDFAKYGDRFDYYIVRTAARDTIYDPGGRLGGAFRLVTSSGRWRLYQRIAPVSPLAGGG